MGHKQTEETKEKIRIANLGNTNWLGKKHTSQTIKKMSQVKLGKNNPLWKGDKVGYQALHDWIRSHLPEPSFCQICNTVSPYDVANISGKYLRDLTDWQWLCRKCHMISDDRILNLDKYRPIMKHDSKTGRFIS